MPGELDIDLVLIAGAGASREFGVNGARLPLMGEWSDHLVRKLAENPTGYLDATRLSSGLGGEEFERRLGDFLRSADAFKTVGDLLGPLASIQPDTRPQANEEEWRHWHEVLSFQLDEIVKVIHESLYEMFGAPVFDPGKVEQAYGTLLSLLHINPSSRWVYATTNYDTIGEYAIARHNALPDAGELQTEHNQSERPIRVAGLLDGMPRYVPVLHLHGRVGWFNRPGMGLRSIHAQQYNPGLGTPVVMLPDLAKAYDGDATIVSIWQEFAGALSRAKRVFVLGHSLHDAALLRALRENVQAPDRIAVTLYENPDETTDAELLKQRVASELPGAETIPFRFEANRDLRSRDLETWVADTGR